MRVSFISFTIRGEVLGERLNRMFAAEGDISDAMRCPEGGLNAWTEARFDQADALIFIGSCGIAVRAVAPYLRSKISDPAVVVIDEMEQHVIPLLSGHIGGANELARHIAELIDAEAVITTATDLNHLFGIDTWAARRGYHIDHPKRIKSISAALLEGRPVKLRSDIPIDGEMPEGFLCIYDYENACDVSITYKASGAHNELCIIPKVITIGIGSRKDVSKEEIETAILEFIRETGIHRKAVLQLASIDLKAEEAGIKECAEDMQLRFMTYSAEELMQVKGNFKKSSFVKKTTGADNVCERAAVLACNGSLICPKHIYGNVTLAAAVSDLSISFED